MTKTSKKNGVNRRAALKQSVFGALGVGALVNQVVVPSVVATNGTADNLGPLLPPDANGLRLPAGFSSRVVATSGLPVGSTSYVWHAAPDGGATFAHPDGGWVYVSNAELRDNDGGVGAIRFANNGAIVDAYAILSGTIRNCAGGPTPWGTWLSCEEYGGGQVWECDPLSTSSEGIVRPLLGKFTHEAAAVDPINQHIYLTEDRGSGLLYRFVPDSYPNLESGVLEAAEISDPDERGPITVGEKRALTWHEVADPTVSLGVATRKQVPAATTFDGGEGCWYENGLIYFATKGDDRIWLVDPSSNEISIVYDIATSSNPILSGVDNVFVSPNGDVYVAEDPGDLQIVSLTPAGNLVPVVQLVGTDNSEICGPALSPDGSRLYFSSQRNPGVTFEVRGPWLGGSAETMTSLPTLGLTGVGLLAAALGAYGLNASRKAKRKV